MSFLKRLAGQTAIYGISSIIGRMLNLFLTPFYTRLFSTGVYGQFSDLYSWTSMLNVVITFGMETTFFRYLREQRNKGQSEQEVYDHAFGVVAIFSLAVFFLCLIGNTYLSQLLGYTEYPNLMIYVGGIMALDGLAALPLAKLRYEEKAPRFAAISLTNVLLTLGLNYYFLKIQHKGLDYVFIANLIASAVRLGMALWGTLPKSIGFRKDLLYEMLSYGGFIMLAGLAGMQNENLDKILLKRLWEDGTLYNGIARSGEDMLGIYSAGYKMGIFISLVTQAFRYAVEPFFFKQSGEKDSPQQFAQIFHYFLLCCLLCFLWIASFAYEIVSVKIFGYHFIDPKFWEGLEIVPIILMAYVFSAAYIQLSIWFKLTKQTHYALLFTGTGAAITIALNLLTIREYGYIGCAWATLICYIFMSILAYTYGQKFYPIPYKIGLIGGYLLAIVLAYGVCHFYFSQSPLLKFLVCFLLTAVISGYEFYKRRKMRT